MAYIYTPLRAKLYAPGWFLAHEECVRETKQIAQEGATTVGAGKFVPMGTLYTEEAEDHSTVYVGFLYEDVDVTAGDMPGSVVTKGVVYEDRLPAELTSTAKTALEAKGFTFVTSPAVIRP